MATPTGRPAGRPAKPVEVKRALGNPGGRPLPAAPMPGEGLPGVDKIPHPPILGLEGLEMWVEIWDAGSSWLSPVADRRLVTMLCQAHDEAEMIRRALATGEVKRLYVVGNGQHVTHPYVNQLKELRVQMTAWLSALGFSPSDRARLGIGEVRQADVFDELRKRREARAAGSTN